jgi:hypothetical protein
MPRNIDEQERRRNLLFLTDPKRWPDWPFLALVRPTGEDDYDCGVLCDLEGLFSLPGFRCTVFVQNLFLVPPTLKELLELPREAFDNFEELLAAGWRIDGPGPDLIILEIRL